MLHSQSETDRIVKATFMASQSPPIHDVDMAMGDIIRALRKRARLSQGALGEALGGLSKQSVSAWERGKTKPERANLEAMAKLFEVAIDAFYRGKPPEISSAITPQALTDQKLLLALTIALVQGDASPDTVTRAREILEELRAEAKEPANPTLGVSDQLQLQLRIETLLRRHGYKRPH